MLEEVVGDPMAYLLVLEVWEAVVVELELLEQFPLALPFLFDRLWEVTGLIPDEDEATVLVMTGDGSCRLVQLEVFETVVEELALLSLLDRLWIDEVIEAEVLKEGRVGVEFVSVDEVSEAVVVAVELALGSIFDRFWEQVDKDVTEVVVSVAEAEATVADGTLPE
jgi:hypothetical protein